MRNGTLVLEGGATRGVFTAGILDFFMEKELYLSHVVGVSAGSCNGVDYVSKQIGRTRDCMIHRDKEHSYYYSFAKVVREKSVLDMDMVFDKYPNDYFPFDYEEYFSSEIECEMVVTNCVSGKAEYMKEKENRNRLMRICRASCSMPLFSPIVNIDEVPYLDGGVADSIPLKRGLAMGNKKVILIQTRNPGYRKKPVSKGVGNLYRKAYKNYPNFVRSSINRNRMYNHQMAFVEKQEELGNVYVIRPLIPTVSRLERNYDTLMNFYEHGYNLAKKEFENVMRYLEG